jgi:hypothetical protein
VGNRWIYRAWSQSGGWGDEYFTRFEVVGKEIINDTTYFVADCKLFSDPLNMKYFRKDSIGNIYTRCENQDRLLFKMTAELGDLFNAACNSSLQRTDDFWHFMYDFSSFPSGGFTDVKLFTDQIYKGSYYVFSNHIGCVFGIYEGEPRWILKRTINSGNIVTPQVTKLISIEFYKAQRKILLKTLAVLDTTTQIILESKKRGAFKGSLVRYRPDPEWDAIYGPYYSIESNLDYSALGDTIKVTIPATVSDILGDKIDGNGNQIWEGSPIDDYTVTVIIPSTTNRVDLPNTLQDYKLNQNYPNPFNPGTKISFNIPESGLVKLIVYDLLGKEIKTLVSENRKSGNYEINFDASSAAGGLPSGIYFYKLQVNNFIESKKMILVK